MMLYYQTKFGCKQTVSLKDLEEKNHIFKSFHCDLDLENSGLIFLLDTLPHDNTALFQVWLKMVEQFSKYCLDIIRHKGRVPDGQTDGQTRQTDTVIHILWKCNS